MTKIKLKEDQVDHLLDLLEMDTIRILSGSKVLSPQDGAMSIKFNMKIIAKLQKEMK